jgi:hypothetical protein
MSTAIVGLKRANAARQMTGQTRIAKNASALGTRRT